MKYLGKICAAAFTVVFLCGAEGDCSNQSKTAEARQAQQQNSLLQEATNQTGMPAIKNFRERKLLKDILELRDQDGLVTYTYTYNEMQGKLVFFCDSIGYGMPYATQYSAPEKDIYTSTNSSVHHNVPQADPNALYSPASAEGTWVMCKNPSGNNIAPVYVEPRVVVSPFKMQ